MIRKFREPGFDICLRNYCGSFADNCGDCHFPLQNDQHIIAEICGDDESAQELRGQTSRSWLVKFPMYVVLQRLVDATLLGPRS